MQIGIINLLSLFIVDGFHNPEFKPSGRLLYIFYLQLRQTFSSEDASWLPLTGIL
jgi:hypothetical protein